MDEEYQARFDAAVKKALSAFTSATREFNVCPYCLVATVGGILSAMEDQGVLKHSNQYTEEEKERSPFHCEGEFSVEHAFVPETTAH